MTLKIISATQVLFEGEVSAVTLPGQNGLFTVLQNHASLISTLTPGDITYQIDGSREAQHIDGGIVDVDRNIVSVCVN
jgi:F-type H+-transporting ATPase subunit epsilon